MSKNETHFKKLSVQALGLVDYKKAYTLQKELQKQRMEEKICDTLLFLEHPKVITLGTRGTLDDVLAKQEILHQHNVQITQVERGGQATLHMPGQLVGYFIFHLYKKRMALREFIEDIEQCLMDTLLVFGIPAQHGTNERGLWVDDAKIASIGISISHGVSMHGFALNVSNALDAFNWIIPCGMPGRKMTSIFEVLQKITRKAHNEVMPSIQKICRTFTSKIIKKRHYTIQSL